MTRPNCHKDVADTLQKPFGHVHCHLDTKVSFVCNLVCLHHTPLMGIQINEQCFSCEFTNIVQNVSDKVNFIKIIS